MWNGKAFDEMKVRMVLNDIICIKYRNVEEVSMGKIGYQGAVHPQMHWLQFQ